MGLSRMAKAEFAYKLFISRTQDTEHRAQNTAHRSSSDCRGVALRGATASASEFTSPAGAKLRLDCTQLCTRLYLPFDERSASQVWATAPN